MRQILTIRDLGEEAAWLLVQQALGIPDPTLQTDFLVQKVALLVFAQQSLPERLCVSAAIRQMGGAVVYEGTQDMWHMEVSEYQEHLLPIFSHYVDCLYTYGLEVSSWGERASHMHFPIINAGSPDAHPAHALADIACMLRGSDDLAEVTCAWLGCVNGTLHSLIEATRWFPYHLRIAVPPKTVDVDSLKAFAAKYGTAVTFVNSPEEAVRDARYIFAGCRKNLPLGGEQCWHIDADLLSRAAQDAQIMLSASPMTAIPVDKAILSSPVSLLAQQATYRLCVHKRMLHWVFLDM